MSDLERLAQAARGYGTRPPPLPPRPGDARWWSNAAIGAVIAVAVIVAAGMVILVVRQQAAPAPSPAAGERWAGTRAVPAVPITAADLVARYETNEVAADAELKGRTLSVSGTVRRIAKDFLDDPYLVLEGNGPFRSVQCSFRKGDEAALAQLLPGQRVEVRGTCGGTILSSVMIRDCTVLDIRNVAR